MTKGSKNEGQGPWGKPRQSGGQAGPDHPASSGGGSDFEDIFRKGQDRFRGVFGGSNGSGGGRFGGEGDADGKKAAWLLAGVALLLWFGSGFYTVDTDEQGVVLRFGKYHRTEMPGLHYHLPWPLEAVYTPSVTSINKEQIGFDDSYGGGRSGASSLVKESLMLTGDLNIVDVNFEVQWKIDSAATDQFLFNVRTAEQLVKPVAESAMREVIGQTPLETILTTGQTEIAARSREIIQQILDSYRAGIQVVSVNLRKPDVPHEVIDAFQDVKRAEQEKNTLINKAQAYRNDILPKARGVAVQAKQEALAYRKEVTERALGDAARFSAVYEEYRQAKDVTKKRLYLETMEQILANMNKYIIDEKGGTGVVPYLPLSELGKNAKAGR